MGLEKEHGPLQVWTEWSENISVATMFLVKYLKRVRGWMVGSCPMQREPYFEVLYLPKGRPAEGTRVEQREGGRLERAFGVSGPCRCVDHRTALLERDARQ